MAIWIFFLWKPILESCWYEMMNFPTRCILSSYIVLVILSIVPVSVRLRCKLRKDKREINLSLFASFSLEFEWQQVSSGLQDSSRYSNWSQQCCSLNGLDSSDFQFLQSSSQAFGEHSKSTNYYHLHIPQIFFSSQARSKYLSIFSFSFIFTQWFAGTAEPSRWQVLFSLVNKHTI